MSSKAAAAPQPTEPTAAPNIATLFEGLDVAFAADIEPTRIDFTLLGKPCFVSLRPMNGDDAARYENGSQKISVDLATRALSRANIDLDLGKQQLDLLCSTVIDFSLPRKRRKGGKEEIEIVSAATLSLDGRRDVFRQLHKKLRDRLIVASCHVNNLPLPGLAGLAATGAASAGN